MTKKLATEKLQEAISILEERESGCINLALEYLYKVKSELR